MIVTSRQNTSLFTFPDTSELEVELDLDHRCLGGWFLSPHSDATVGVARLLSPGNLAAPPGISLMSLLLVSGPRK